MKKVVVVTVLMTVLMFVNIIYASVFASEWPAQVLEIPTQSFRTDPGMCSVSLNSPYIVSGGDWSGGPNFVKIYDLNGGMISNLPYQDHNVLALTMSRDRIFTADGKVVRQWNMSGQEIRSLTGHKSEIYALDCTGDFLASSGGFDNTIRVTDLRWETVKVLGQERLKAYDFTPPWISAVKFVDSYTILSGHDDGARVWNISSGSSYKLPGNIQEVYSVAVSKRYFAAGSRADGKILVWDTGTSLVHALDYPGGSVFSLDFSPDGRYLAAARQYNIVQIFDVLTDECVAELRHNGGDASVIFAKFTEDGRLVSATTYPEGVVRIWNLTAVHPTPMINMIIGWGKMRK